jgi:hypothetical protein
VVIYLTITDKDRTEVREQRQERTPVNDQV